MNTNRNADDDGEEQDPNVAAMANARGALVSSIMKKNLMENVVPVFIELKHLLAAQHSPLQGTSYIHSLYVFWFGSKFRISRVVCVKL